MRKLGLLLTVVVGAVMLVAGSAGAADTAMVFEIQVSGKGLRADQDAPAALYGEGKHRFKEAVYARLDLESMTPLLVAYQDGGVWKLGETGFFYGYQTHKGYLLIITDQDIEDGYFSGSLQTQVKLKNGVVTSARIKSLGAFYDKYLTPATLNDSVQTGAAKVKGKMIDRNDLPPAVRSLFFEPI